MYKHSFLTRLPTRQDGVENRDKVYTAAMIWNALPDEIRAVNRENGNI